MKINTAYVMRSVVKDDRGRNIAELTTSLTGDGSTPVVQTTGMAVPTIIGYNDQGGPIFDEDTQTRISNAQKEFMAQAIAKQKELTKDNGGNPDTVNLYGAEEN